jgi:hypothetical protein
MEILTKPKPHRSDSSQTYAFIPVRSRATPLRRCRTGGSDGVFHAPQNLEKGGHGVSPCTMHHLKSFSPGLESVLFRTLFLSCRVPDKIPFSNNEQSQICAVTDADYGLTDPVNGF